MRVIGCAGAWLSLIERPIAICPASPLPTINDGDLPINIARCRRDRRRPRRCCRKHNASAYRLSCAWISHWSEIQLTWFSNPLDDSLRLFASVMEEWIVLRYEKKLRTGFKTLNATRPEGRKALISRGPDRDSSLFVRYSLKSSTVN